MEKQKQSDKTEKCNTNCNLTLTVTVGVILLPKLKYSVSETRANIGKMFDFKNKKLRSLNLPDWVSFEIANCRKGIWHSALVLNPALTNKELVNLGYISLIGYYLQVRDN